MKVLIIDDNHEFCSTLADIVQSFKLETKTIQSPEEAIKFLDSSHRQISAILLDIEFGPEAKLNGLDLLARFRRDYPAIPVIMVTGRGTIDAAVQATKLGAVNFIEKSVMTKDKLRGVLNSALERFSARTDAHEIVKFMTVNGIVCKSPAMLEVGDSIIRFGRTDLNVLISGETGTGKKLVAKAIHMASRRAKYPFVTVDIPNIPRELFQSELFGHNKGSFSGASETKKGLFHKAHKGTLFLDEIGDLSPELQANLFIPIEEKIVRRVGAIESEDVDIRFVSATDKDLIYAMKESKFREQLYHRLRECEIYLPPLRERREDIPLIAEFYMQKHNQDYEDSKFFSPAAVEFLQEQDWRGNVRELASVIRVTLQTARTDQIEVADVHKIYASSKPAKGDGQVQAETIISSDRTLKEDLAIADKKKIEATLARSNGNVSKSAALLGVSRETLHNKIRKYGINTQMYRQKKS